MKPAQSSFIREVIVASCLLLIAFTSAQSIAQLSYRKGQHVEPAYEGWRENEDGTISFFFGYFNENWEEVPYVPLGENNFFSPGEADRGQPTNFLPRRNRFTFEVKVPPGWGDRELVWTLTVNGITKKAYATQTTDYVIDNIIIASETGSMGAGTSSPESRSNLPPRVSIVGETTDGRHVRNVMVGDELTLAAIVEDDGLPKPRPSLRRRFTSEELMLMPPQAPTVRKTNGLFLSWNLYRGPGKVAFSPDQIKPWEDTRPAANSPWGALWTPPPVPEDGHYEVKAIFHEPGTYVLWARADDGGLYHDQYVTVNVSPK